MILHEHNDITLTQWHYTKTHDITLNTMILHEHNDITLTQWHYTKTMTLH